MACPHQSNICTTSATCWYDWSRDCAAKITTLASSELASQNCSTLLYGSRIYIVGDGSTWATHDFTYHADVMTSAEYAEDEKEEENWEEEEEGPEQEPRKGKGKGKGKGKANIKYLKCGETRHKEPG